MTDFLYIHIPFCKKKCKYCSFISIEDIKLIDEYIAALLCHIKSNYKGEKLKTIYIGGGTPSLLNVNQIRQILKVLNFDSSTEITMEVNPSDVNFEYLQGLRNAGINRLSLGIQSFDDGLLSLIGRRHTSAQAEQAVLSAQKAGFTNINADVIYGLPSQTLQNYKDTLKKLIDLEVEHISLYGLKIEEGCFFFKNPPEDLPDDEMQAEMYLLSCGMLKEAGYEHYEISNFAKNGFSSRHNLNYWDAGEYYGFGAAAHGYSNGIRYANRKNVKEYVENPLELENSHSLSAQERLEEKIFLGFRKLAGINIAEINEEFSIDFEKKYEKIIKKYTELKHIQKTSNGYKLTENGALLSNYFLSEFLDCY